METFQRGADKLPRGGLGARPMQNVSNRTPDLVRSYLVFAHIPRQGGGCAVSYVDLPYTPQTRRYSSAASTITHTGT